MSPPSDPKSLAEKKKALLARLLEQEGLAQRQGQPLRPRADRSRAPLSFAQQRLWFLEQLDPGKPTYNMQYTVRLRGALSVGALERALAALARRHEALRTSFTEHQGEAIQQIQPELELPLTVETLEGHGGEQQAALEQRIQEEAQRPFDLRHGPLIRVRLLRLGEHEHVLLLAMHHLITDGWSLGVLFEELGQLYRASLRGEEGALPGLPIQYGDYAEWQREWARGPGLAEQVAWWKQQLAGAPLLLELPTDRPRPAHLLVKGARYECVLPGRLAEELTTLARQEGATLYMVLLAAFEVLLHRYTGQADLLVGTPIAQRTRVETERLIGCFASTLVLRGDLSGNPRFRELLRRTREHCLGAYAHQDVPFERLVEELQPERSLNHSPLFQVMFVFQNTASDLSLEGVSVERIPADTGTTTFDLSLTMEPSARGLDAVFNYSTDLFDEATVARLGGHLRTLLEGISSRPEARLSELPLIPPAELHQLLAQWNDTPAPLPQALALHRLFEEQVLLAPQAVAVTLEGQRLSYSELDSRANQLAHHLRSLGVRAESRVGVCLERSLEMIVALLGTLKAGAAYVPLEPSYPQERLAFMAGDAQLELVLCHSATATLAGSLATRSLAIDTQWPDISRQPSSPLECDLSGSTLAYVIYTSGSTGRPKGVMNTHRGVCNHLLWMRRHFRIGPEDSSLQKTALGFDVSVLEIFLPLVAGARLVLARPGGHQDNTYLAGLIAAERVTTLNFVPSMLQHFLEEPDVGRSCVSVRRVMCGGEAMPPELPRRFYERLDAPLFNLYGPTEASIDTACWSCERQPSRASVPIGFPISNLQLFILDRSLQPVPIGVPGELFIGGLGLARGYLSRPDLTAERFIPHPFSSSPGQRLYRTGDLARFLPDGSIDYLGRTDHQVKLRGFRIELGEIESALTSLPGVREALVLLRKEPSGDSRLVAYLVSQPSSSLEPSDLRAHLRLSLPEHMVPSSFVLLERFPLSPNGKVDRSALPPPPQSQPSAPASQALPSSSLEQSIASVWREVLGLQHVGLHDNFFDLGGHSLLLLRVHRKLRDELKLTVSMMDLFRHPSISALAGYLNTQGNAPSSRPQAQPQTQKRRRPVGDGASAQVAVVGMGLRLPGADTPEAFWRNLADGVESIRSFSDEELRARGVEASTLEDPHYVKASASLDDIASFDAALFGYTPREAELMDPQHRLFLECCWEALEHAGHSPASFPGRIGVFAGASVNNYLLFNVMPRAAEMSRGDVMSAIASSTDQLATRAAYKLNLRGPSLSVQTACSTSLVAVHLACQSLLLGESDMALAGGVSLDVPQQTGYTYTPGGILSPDGHCRPFSAHAQGTVPGNGVACVLLKRLEDALSDGDSIYAVILSSAINNDGSSKVGFTAPSIDGQAQVISDALSLAGISADSIGLVEAHGTGTALGDPIEVSALTQAFRSSTDKTAFCALGSVKSNLGHLDAAAGVVGLLKAALSLHHQQLPPSLHCLPPHPDIPFSSSPFFLSDSLRPWPSSSSHPRRAAVSSFGIGGTNAHLILQEAPPPPPPSSSHRSEHLLLLSAHSPQALEQLSDSFSNWAHSHPHAHLPDVSFTLQLGRSHLPHKRFLLASSLSQAASALDSRLSAPLPSSVSSRRDAPVFFLFPGQGSQHPLMASHLYSSEPFFRSLLDQCCSLLKPLLGLDLRSLLFPPEASLSEAASRLSQTALAQPALFAVEYCLARLWMHWGLRPSALLGHSIGEYVAACLAGVFSLQDALALVCLRGKLLQQLPSGSMLAVPLPEAELLPLLGSSVDLAAVNTPSLCVLSGPHSSLSAFSEQLRSRGISSTPLHTSHAFHSRMVEPALPAFSQALSRLSLHPPSIPILSNLSGQLLSASDATSPSYWVRHLRSTVRFSDALHSLPSLAEQPLLLESGPGSSLSSFARLHPSTSSLLALQSLPHPKHQASASSTHLLSLGQLWLHGARIDWKAFHSSPARRLPLPSLPFQRQRFWIGPSSSASSQPASSQPASSAPPPPSSHPRPNLSSPYSPPRNEIEQLLISSWQQLFGISPIGIHDDFFELGGHSLLATQLCSLLSQRLSLQVSLSLLFQNPSPSLLASSLEALMMETTDV